ncbi:hypothetical protein G5B30_07080 [Sphingobacterium sp. SGG-5]|uniref:hypothetical protein n=1 Tax=Sphingobacterium sp. SGG-5 TaxID=2710881 RepID=UPI0013EADCB8|nr:hypothetical protein [Sphingobacterium sp. SGG-5]NGM61679.1 hypothetical protein [Sphingobacterium sp. SGG-5]
MLYAKMLEEQERKNDFRLLLGYIVKFGGMGVNDNITLESIMHLPLIDNEYKELPIRSVEEAMDVLNKLIYGQA